MGDIINLADRKFSKTNASKIVNACDILDREVVKLIIEDDVPPNELLAALCQRIGVYLSCTDADKEAVIKRLTKIIYKYSKTP